MQIKRDYVEVTQDHFDSENGFLSVKANLTRTGVFTYYERVDGQTKRVRQLRHPDEVFSDDSLSTLTGIPITDNHPTAPVRLQNAKDLMIGMGSGMPEKVNSPIEDKEDYVSQKLTFFDSDAIGKVKSKKKKELSLGYTCEVIDETGVWNGQKYDQVQTKIRYNHLSLVDRGRAGNGCRVFLDSFDNGYDGLTLNDEGIDEMLKKFVVDGKEYEVEPGIYQLLTRNQATLDALKEELGTMKDAQSALEGERDELKDKLKVQDSEDEQVKFREAVRTRVDLIAKATKIHPDIKHDEMSDLEIKRAVLLKEKPEIKEKLDSQPEAYTDARFDVLVENFKVPTGDKKIGKNLVTDTGNDGTSYEEARKKANLKAREQWKTIPGKRA